MQPILKMVAFFNMGAASHGPTILPLRIAKSVFELFQTRVWFERSTVDIQFWLFD